MARRIVSDGSVGFVLLLGAGLAPPIASAQSLASPTDGAPIALQGFLTLGAGSQLGCEEGKDPERYVYVPEVGTAALLAIARSGLAVGAQANVCTRPHIRGGPVIEYAIGSSNGRVQPFAKTGLFAAAYGWRVVVGGGVHVRRKERSDIRLSIEDAFRRSYWRDNGARRPTPWFRHELSFHVGWRWR